MKTIILMNSCYICALNVIDMNLTILPLVIGWPQIVLIVVVVLLLFGGRKIPELMRGIGQGMKEFKKATKDNSDDEKEDKEKEQIK